MSKPVLFPAVRLKGKIHVGSASDSHDTIEDEKGIRDGERGFSIGNDFLTRKAAIGFLKVHSPVVYGKVAGKSPDGLHTAELAKAQGFTQKQRKAVEDKKPDDLSNKSMIIYDRGGLTYIAQFMAKFFKEVKYCTPNGELYPKSPQAQVGKGLPGVEWISSLRKHKEKTDVIFFPYLYDEDRAAELRDEGLPVCGGSPGAKTELDKWFFLEELEKQGLPVPYTYRAEGLTDLRGYIADHPDKKMVLKYAEPYRGDFETLSHTNKYKTELILQDVEEGLGLSRKEEVIILAQDWVKGVETGVDPLRFGGKMPAWSCAGTEVKDDGYVCQVFESFPPVIQKVLDATAPIYDRLGFNGPYSNEMRITPSGKVYLSDDTDRCGNPPTPVILLMYGKSYAQAIYDMAHGIMPALKHEFKYGVHVNLRSIWFLKHDLHIGCPKDSEDWLKLHNAVRRNQQYYCLPILSEEDFDNFGSVVATSNKSLKDAENKIADRIKSLDVHKMRYDEDLFGECERELDKCRAIGIPFD